MNKIDAIISIVITLFLVITINIYTTRHQNIENYKMFIEKTEIVNLFILFLIFIYLFFTHIKDIKNVIKVDKKYLILLLLLIILNLVFTVSFVPFGNRLYFDEDIYLDMAKQIRNSRISALCDFYLNRTCYKYELMKWPSFYPLLISLIPYKITWNTVSIFNVIISSLTILVIFCSSYLLTKNEFVSLISSIIFLLSPVRILWSTSNASETVFSFMVVFTIFSYLLFYKTKKSIFFLLSLISLVLTAETKIEGAVLVIPFIFTIVNSRIIGRMRKNVNMLLFLFVLLLLFTPFFLRYVVFIDDSWGSNGKKFSISYLHRNVLENLKFLFSYDLFDKNVAKSKQLYNNYFSGMLYMLSIPISIVLSLKNKDILVVTMSFLSLFFLYSLFYAGSVTFGVDVRYMIPIISTLSILSAPIINLLIKDKIQIYIIILIFIFLSFIVHVKNITSPLSKLEEAKECRVYHNFIISSLPKINESCMFISHVTSIYTISDRNNIQIWLFEMNPNTIKNESCIILDYGYWCGIDQHKDICNEILDTYPHKLLYTSQCVNGKQYKLFKLYI